MGAPLLIIIIVLVFALITLLSTGVVYAILRICYRLSIALSGDTEYKKSSLERKATRKKHFWIAFIIGTLICACYLYQLSIFNGPPWIN